MSEELKNELVKIDTSFEKTLKDSDLRNVIRDGLEIGIDSMLEQGLLKDIPIVSVISDLITVGANIKDRLFLEKIIHFLSNLKDIDIKKRKEMITKIDESGEYSTRVGKKIMYIIDSCDDSEIAGLVSKVFAYYINEKISYEEFLKTASILKDMNKIDFDWFVKDRKNHYFDLSEVGDLIHTGLFNIYYDDIRVNVTDTEDTDRPWLEKPITMTPTLDVDTNKEKFSTDVEGGVSVNISRSGEILLEIFCKSYKKPKIVKI